MGIPNNKLGTPISKLYYCLLPKSHLALFHPLQNTFFFQRVAKVLQKQNDNFGEARKPA